MRRNWFFVCLFLSGYFDRIQFHRIQNIIARISSDFFRLAFWLLWNYWYDSRVLLELRQHKKELKKIHRLSERKRKKMRQHTIREFVIDTIHKRHEHWPGKSVLLKIIYSLVGSRVLNFFFSILGCCCC